MGTQKNFQSKNILLLGAGNTINEHKDFIENYIQREKPIVIALNANMHINSELINYRIASHPLRILADAKKFQNLNQPIITPTDLSSENNKIWENKKIYNYGLKIENDKFVIGDNFCIVPYSNVLAYALSIFTSGNVMNVYIAGFDGYTLNSLNDRNEEMNAIFTYFLSSNLNGKILSITPTIYKVPQVSLYGL